MTTRRLRFLLLAALLALPAGAVERQDVTFKVFQFPANMIPRIDGNTDDWAMVPDSYAIGMDELMDTERRPWHEPRPEEYGREGQGRLGEGPQPPVFPV